MHIEIENVYSRVVDVRPEDAKQLDALQRACTVEFRYTGMDQDHRPVERTIKRKFFSDTTRQFPTGWVGQLLRDQHLAFRDSRVRPERVDAGLVPGTPWSVSLRPYQLEAVQACIKASRGVIAHPTGAGKSVVIAELVRRLRVRTLYVVPKLDLLIRAHALMKAAVGEHAVGQIGEGTFDPGSFVTVATPQTLWSRRDQQYVKDFLNSIDCLIIDEAHHVDAREVALGFKWVTRSDGKKGILREKSFDVNTWWQIAAACPAYYRFGFTATPGEAESPARRMLESMTGRVLHHKTARELSDAGFLAYPEVHMHVVHSRWFEDWQDAVKLNLVLNEKRNALIQHLVQQELAEGRRVLIVVDRVQHGKALQQQIEGSKFVHGVVPGEEREAILQALRKGGCVIGTVFDEGTDIPELDTVVIASAGRSDRKLLQRIGRVLRPSADGKQARVIDFYDKDGRNPTTKVPGMLSRQAKSRKKLYEAQQYVVTLMEEEPNGSNAYPRSSRVYAPNQVAPGGGLLHS